MERNGRQDHPRVGGEKNVLPSGQCTRPGSPPRRRGKEIGLDGMPERVRITPAWAGKSRSFIRFHFFGEDHPRVGGEKLTKSSAKRNEKGSPPRGRGKGLGFPALSDLLGITPAWAGKRDKPALILRVVKDHPRVGGEKQTHPPAPGRLLGSPPRGRGKVELA